MPASEPLRCKQCGGPAEEARRCYATPVCYSCLPPPKPLDVVCMPPTHAAFDYDIYDCGCGHMYGDHEYHYVDRRMVIDHCTVCGARGDRSQRNG